MLILGDFGSFNLANSTNYGEDMSYWQMFENKLITVFFVLSTFLTNIVILNMLIAIMSATFDKHKDEQRISKIKQRLFVQAEFVWLIEFYEKILCCRFGNSGNENK